MSEKIAVRCETEEEWDSIVSKRGFGNCDGFSTLRRRYPAGVICLSTHNRDGSDLSYFSGAGYTIISAAEYLQEFKVGDRVRAIKEDKHFKADNIKVGDTLIFKGYSILGDRLRVGRNMTHAKECFELETSKQTEEVYETATSMKFRAGHYSQHALTDMMDSFTYGVGFNKININDIYKENDMKINQSIRKVFTGDTFELVEAMQENFGTEIAETFTGEIGLKRDKKLYIAELTRREEEAKKAVEAK